jgi:hypothetical protein
MGYNLHKINPGMNKTQKMLKEGDSTIGCRSGGAWFVQVVGGGPIALRDEG